MLMMAKRPSSAMTPAKKTDCERGDFPYSLRSTLML